MDIRIEKTRQSIINAFIELRSHKELERITIKELCEKAQINKSTFYAHYQDIYHLSDTLETEVVVSIMENLTHCFFFQRTVYGVSGKGFADWNFVFRKQE